MVGSQPEKYNLLTSSAKIKYQASNSLPHNKVSNLFDLKVHIFADDKLNVPQMI